MHGRVHDPLLVGLAGGEFLDHTALPGDEDPIRETENFRQIRRNHHDGDAAVGEIVDDLMEIGDGADVDAAGRLIEYDSLGSCTSDRATTTFC